VSIAAYRVMSVTEYGTLVLVVSRFYVTLAISFYIDFHSSLTSSRALSAIYTWLGSLGLLRSLGSSSRLALLLELFKSLSS
jgi:hypothetical protein